jgi:hypothetical protein
MYCLCLLKHWDHGFESHSRCGCLYCMCLFYVRVILRVGSGLATGWSPSKKSYWLSVGLRNWKSSQGPTKGYRAIIIIILVNRNKSVTHRHNKTQNIDNRLGRPSTKYLLIFIAVAVSNIKNYNKNNLPAATLENVDNDMYINRAWDTVRENITISGKESHRL